MTTEIESLRNELTLQKAMTESAKAMLGESNKTVGALRAENVKLKEANENARRDLRALGDKFKRYIDSANDIAAATKLFEDELKEKLASTEAHNRMLREALDLLLNDVGRASSLPGAVLARAALSTTPSDALDAWLKERLDVVDWEFRHEEDAPDEWRKCEPRNPYVNTVQDTVDEIRSYINSGFKYELRPLYRLLPSNLMNEVKMKEAK